MNKYPSNHELKWMKLIASKLGIGLSDEELFTVAEMTEELEFKKGERILNEGSSSRDIYIVAAGKISVWLDLPAVNRLEKRAAVMSENEVFGEFAFVSGKPRTASIQADTSVTVLRLEYEALITLFKENPALGCKLLQNIAAIITEKVIENQTALRRMLLFS